MTASIVFITGAAISLVIHGIAKRSNDVVAIALTLANIVFIISVALVALVIWSKS